MRGFGQIGRSAKNEPAAAPAVTGANNGLTVVAGNVQLGGANPLIQNTTIDLSTFFLQANDPVFDYLFLNVPGQEVTLGDPANSMGVLIQLPIREMYLGANAAVGNGTRIGITDTDETVVMQSDNIDMFVFEGNNQRFRMGDVGNSFNNSIIDIQDANQLIVMNAGLGNANIELNGTPATELFALEFGGFRTITVDPPNSNYFFGDLAGLNNQTALLLSDAAQQAQIGSGGFSMLFLDMGAGIFQLGASAGGTANTSYLQINDGTQRIETYSAGNLNGLLLDMANLNFYLGDAGGVGNSTYIVVDDALQRLSVIATNGISTLGDATMIHTQTGWGNGAAAAAGTLLNAPAAGDPTKWIPVDDNGTVRYIPAW